MRVLYYNWVDYLDEEARGGGVTVYQRNLMRAEHVAGHQVTFLASGISYDLSVQAPRWEAIRHGPVLPRERRYEIINSGVLSPGHHSFGNPAQLDHPETEAVICDFIEATGPYDVIHFNNLEGVPANVLAAIRGRWPDLRLILTLHNYYPFCSQVNLWRDETETCTDFERGQRCATCLTQRHDPRLIRLANGLAYRMKCLGMRPGTKAFDTVFWLALRVGKRIGQLVSRRRAGGAIGGPEQVAPAFVNRRNRMVGLINANCDRVLCVSDAVRHLARHYGISREILHTSYIGTREAALFADTAPRRFPQAGGGTLALAYLGYMRRDKGFFFLLEALEGLPDALVARLRLTVAARKSDEGHAMARLWALGERLAGLHHEDGYSHDDLDRLLAGVDVGVIPVLWHDNLPQVAIEMHARHIPLLCSDMGGAQELGRCSEMVFPAGDIAAFQARICALLDGQVDMHAYWQGAVPPVDMPTHLQDLNTAYKGA